MINYHVSNSYGIGDALHWLNAIFLFEKEKDRNITITFHQRDDERKNFDFKNTKDIYDFFCLKPTDTVCTIDYTKSNLEPDDLGEENFRIEGFEKFYFDTIYNHNIQLNLEQCAERKGTSAMFYESGKGKQTYPYKGKHTWEFRSITADQYQKIKDKLDPIELHQWDGEKRTTNMFFTTMKNPYLIPANLKMINESAKFVGSEGLWSHYSRALGVETHCINKSGRYLDIKREFDVIAQIFKKQKHFLYNNFDDLYYGATR